MPLFSRLIDSLHIRLHQASFLEVVRPMELTGAFESHNHIVLLEKGHLTAGKDHEFVPPQSFYFFPAGQPINVRYGSGSRTVVDGDDFFNQELWADYFRPVSGLSDYSEKKDVVITVSFDVLLYDTIPFFETLGIPPFPLTPDQEFSHLIRYIALESEQDKLGKEKILRNYMEEILIHMCRYIERKPHLRKYVERLEYLTDRRLVDIVKHIQTNLNGDLSNKVLANVAFVSEDYVGQFFKTLTGTNLQDYIEGQRLQQAKRLLQTRPDSIQEISREVGFRDPAYFSRRFKMRFGMNANTMRTIKVQN
jgi:AraC-like DNA-binding protein